MLGFTESQDDVAGLQELIGDNRVRFTTWIRRDFNSRPDLWIDRLCYFRAAVGRADCDADRNLAVQVRTLLEDALPPAA